MIRLFIIILNCEDLCQIYCQNGLFKVTLQTDLKQIFNEKYDIYTYYISIISLLFF